jgi:hypothetical protein
MTKTASIANVTGRTSENAASPTAPTRTVRISSVPYPDEEIRSQESTPTAIGVESRSTLSCSVTSGLPNRRHFFGGVETTRIAAITGATWGFVHGRRWRPGASNDARNAGRNAERYDGYRHAGHLTVSRTMW